MARLYPLLHQRQPVINYVLVVLLKNVIVERYGNIANAKSSSLGFVEKVG
jgi:predicted acyltransferase